MSKRGADWYKREPRAFLEGVRRMTEREIAVYAVVLDLIYDGGHDTYDDPKHIASYFSDLGSSAVRRAIDSLVQAGKLIRKDGKLTNKRAETEGKTREELKKTRRKVGKNGGISSGISRSEMNKINEVDEPKSTDTRAIDKIRIEIEDIEPKGSPSSRGKRVTDDGELQAEFEKQFWPAYPRKVDKKDAFKAFSKARKQTSLETILQSLKAYCREVDGKEANFIRHAARWLNAQPWNDTAAAPSASVDETTWAKRLRYAREHRRWDVGRWGPMPGAAECAIPEHLLQPNDGAGWREWEQAA